MSGGDNGARKSQEYATRMLQRSATETANEVASMTDSMAVMQRRWTIALLIAVAGGLWLRVVEFGAHRSFSIDEAALARNVIGRSWRQLVEPLDFAQVAPPLFLWLQKASLALPVMPMKECPCPTLGSSAAPSSLLQAVQTPANDQPMSMLG